MERTLLILALFAAAGPAAAQEDPYGDALGAARAALAAKDWAAVRARLSEAEALAPKSGALLPSDAASAVPFLRGAAAWHQDRHDEAFDHWREAIVMAPTLQPDKAALPDPAAQDAFYALVGEVKARPEVLLGIPEDLEEGAIFVDGQKREAGDAVLEGRHLVQVRCPEGGVKGAWYTFGDPPPAYFTLCEGGSYPVTKSAKPPRREARPKPAPKPPKEPKAEPAEEPAPKKEPAAKERAVRAEPTRTEPAPAEPTGAGPTRTEARRHSRAVDVSGGVLLAGAAAGGVMTWYSWGQTQEIQAEWVERGSEAAFHAAYVVPWYTYFYASAGATGVLLLGGTTLVLLDGGPSLAPLPGGGGLLGWNGRF